MRRYGTQGRERRSSWPGTLTGCGTSGIWHEVRTYGGIWREQAEILVIEPASVPHGLGLAEAIDRDQARWLEPGDL